MVSAATNFYTLHFDVVKRKRQEELLEIEAKIQIYTLRNDQDNISEWVDKKLKIIEQQP